MYQYSRTTGLELSGTYGFRQSCVIYMVEDGCSVFIPGYEKS
jgi:hypothetical protein